MGIQADEFVIQVREHVSVLENVLLSLEPAGARPTSASGSTAA